MSSRIDLQNTFESILGSRNVYYQPPESIKMQYTAIVYSKDKLESVYADDIKYSHLKCYQVIVISHKVDDPVIEKLLELPYSSFVRHYVVDNLHHDVLRIYY